MAKTESETAYHCQFTQMQFTVLQWGLWSFLPWVLDQVYNTGYGFSPGITSNKIRDAEYPQLQWCQSLQTILYHCKYVLQSVIWNNPLKNCNLGLHSLNMYIKLLLPNSLSFRGKSSWTWSQSCFGKCHHAREYVHYAFEDIWHLCYVPYRLLFSV